MQFGEFFQVNLFLFHSPYAKVPKFEHINILYRDRHPDGLTLNK